MDQNDEEIMKKLQEKSSKKKEVMLSDLIMQQMEKAENGEGEESMMQQSDIKISAKLMEAYKSLGTILKTYKSGKLPKIFKILPNIQRWEEVVPYSQPSSWSPAANEAATKMFVS